MGGCDKSSPMPPVSSGGLLRYCGTVVRLNNDILHSQSDLVSLRVEIRHPDPSRSGGPDAIYVEGYLRCGALPEGVWESWVPQEGALKSAGPVVSGLNQYVIPGLGDSSLRLYVPVSADKKANGTPYILTCRVYERVSRCSVEQLLSKDLHLSYTYQTDTTMWNWRIVAEYMRQSITLEK